MGTTTEGAKRDCKGKGGQNGHLSTAEKLAKEYGVSARTIRRDAAAVRILDAHPEKANLVMQGEANGRT